mgnify:CR=1 FL=1
MTDLIDRAELYKHIAELEELARNRVCDTPTNSPAYMRYVAQLNERTYLKHEIADAPTIDPVTAAAEALGMSPDRLRELAQAEKTGQLVVLSEPMKPMVYKPNDTDVYCPSCGETLSGGWPLSDADDLRKLCQCPNCGQSIDDTRCEAAEAALDAMGGENNA